MTAPAAIVAFHAAETGGPLRSLEQELRWLAGRTRLEILIPATGEPGRALAELGRPLERGPYESIQAPRSPLAWPGTAVRLRRELRWFRGRIEASSPSLALAVTSTLPAFIAAARLEGVPVVLWVGELWPGRGRLRGGLGGILLELQARRATEVIACSETVARQLPGGARVTTIHPPVAAPGPGDGPGFRRRHAIPADARLIAAVGSITPARGQDVLLRALAALRRSIPELRCVIEGEPFPRPDDLAFSAELDRLTSQLGLGDAVVRTLRTDPLPDLYAAADAIVNPATTHPESFGRVPLEAGLAGTPSVCTRVGAIPELHGDGVTALLVAPADAEALSGAIARLLADRELGERLASGAAELARRIADPGRSLAAFQALVEPIIAATGPGAARGGETGAQGEA
jgi:glycosyltransferase involved in cell wall biosynthesis